MGHSEARFAGTVHGEPALPMKTVPWMAAGDLNGDGAIDLAVAGQGRLEAMGLTAGGLSVLLDACAP